MNRINFKRKKNKSLTKEQQESYGNAQICFINNIAKLEIIFIAQENIEVLQIAHVI